MNYSKERRVYIDFMRICAVFLVMFNHLPGYNLFQISEGYKTWIYTFLTMFTRINVPIFFMITGSLLLGRDEGIGEIFRKRISKMIMVLFLFGAIFYFVSGLPNIRFDVVGFKENCL